MSRSYGAMQVAVTSVGTWAGRLMSTVWQLRACVGCGTSVESTTLSVNLPPTVMG